MLNNPSKETELQALPEETDRISEVPNQGALALEIFPLAVRLGQAGLSVREAIGAQFATHRLTLHGDVNRLDPGELQADLDRLIFEVSKAKQKGNPDFKHTQHLWSEATRFSSLERILFGLGFGIRYETTPSDPHAQQSFIMTRSIF